MTSRLAQNRSMGVFFIEAIFYGRIGGIFCMYGQKFFRIFQKSLKRTSRALPTFRPSALLVLVVGPRERQHTAYLMGRDDSAPLLIRTSGGRIAWTEITRAQ
jgi:hypothetical protein